MFNLAHKLCAHTCVFIYPMLSVAAAAAAAADACAMHMEAGSHAPEWEAHESGLEGETT